MKYYKYTFANGYYFFAPRLSKRELEIEEKKYGKLISKTREY